MPGSDNATNEPLKNFFQNNKVKKFNVLDCGVGSGKIGQLLSGLNKKKVTVYGIEVFAPYIEDMNLQKEISSDLSFYHVIHIKNFVSFLRESPEKKYDYVVFGDSLEHLYADVAEYTLEKAIRVSKRGVMVCAPIVPLEQGEVHGNIAETHYLKWKKDNYEHLGGLDLGGSEVVRCFYYKPDLDSYAYKPRSEFEQKELGWTFTNEGNPYK